jgi:hypothetical protein
MAGEVYVALVARVGGALDYEVRWQPNEHERDGYIKRVRPLELIHGVYTPADCSQYEALTPANRGAVM